jgi:hypothetical protein
MMTTCALPACTEVQSTHYKKTDKHEELSLKLMFTQHPCGKQLSLQGASSIDPRFLKQI